MSGRPHTDLEWLCFYDAMEDKQSKYSKCFVPECNNNVGVLFPKSWEVRKNWLATLRLDHLTPDSRSFVCLDHFGEDGQPFTRIKSPHPNSTRKEVSSGAVNKFHKKMCRLCMVESSNVTERVYSKLNEKHTIAQAIAICLHPLKVLPNDNLSKLICVECRIFLKEYLTFHTTCLRTDCKQRQLFQRQNNHDVNPVDSDNSDNLYLYEERLSDYENDKENKEKTVNDHSNGQIVSKSSNGLKAKKPRSKSQSHFEKKNDDGNEELLKVLEGNDDAASTEKNNGSDRAINALNPVTDHVESSINEENDYLSGDADENSQPCAESSDKETDYIEDIIIELVDDDGSSSDQIETPKRPVIIKRLDNTKNHSMKRTLDPSNNNSISKKSRTVMQEDNNEINKPFCSPLGEFPCRLVRYVFDTEFLLSGGYLYEYRLTKGNVRLLHCLLTNCPGIAQQLKIDSLVFSREITVTTPHNHQIPGATERKKQMFYFILYDKMRRDKCFNFKALYEEFCKLDSTIEKILPFRTVISQICKQPPTPVPHSVKSFDELFNKVENNEYQWVHFTDNRVQFYQDKLTSDDGGKALLFGNPEVIKKYSYSNIMYVDSSFFIESEGFPFTLVTVLLWVEPGCYYPILFCLINMKSQQLYMKIFSFLYKKLAPQLKPQEIIADYEANLYYALCITYEESSIGGSMFYFTQNIYKKICSQNLARELELNANFRSIYNMILMLPLLPVNTILDGLTNIEIQAKELDLDHLTLDLFQHVREEWIKKVTPEFFCVHRLENRINENIVAPFKKLRDFLMLTRSKSSKLKNRISAITTIEKLLELDRFLRQTYDSPTKHTFGKDISSNQKKAILKAWNYIENHPMINIHQFFLKVLGYIKCMENQLWIWGLYRFTGSFDDTLINASNFSIVKDDGEEIEPQQDESQQEETMGHAAEVNESEEDTASQVAEEYYIDEEGVIRKVEPAQLSNNVESLDEAQDKEQEIELAQSELTAEP